MLNRNVFSLIFLLWSIYLIQIVIIGSDFRSMLHYSLKMWTLIWCHYHDPSFAKQSYILFLHKLWCGSELRKDWTSYNSFVFTFGGLQDFFGSKVVVGIRTKLYSLIIKTCWIKTLEILQYSTWMVSNNLCLEFKFEAIAVYFCFQSKSSQSKTYCFTNKLLICSPCLWRRWIMYGLFAYSPLTLDTSHIINC